MRKQRGKSCNFIFKTFLEYLTILFLFARENLNYISRARIYLKKFNLNFFYFSVSYNFVLL